MTTRADHLGVASSCDHLRARVACRHEIIIEELRDDDMLRHHTHRWQHPFERPSYGSRRIPLRLEDASHLPEGLDAEKALVVRLFPTLGWLHNGPLAGDAASLFDTTLGAPVNQLVSQRASS